MVAPLGELTPRDLKRGKSLCYLLLLARALSRGRVTVREAAEEVGVSYHTVYRLLRSLEVVGLRVEQQREGREVFWRLRRQDLLAWLSAPPDATWRPSRRRRAASR